MVTLARCVFRLFLLIVIIGMFVVEGEMPKVNSEVLRDPKPESGGGQMESSGQKPPRKLKVNIPKRLRMAPPIDEYNQTTITYLSTTRRSSELSFGDKMLCFAKSGSGVGILATVGFFLVIAVIIAALFVCRK